MGFRFRKSVRLIPGIRINFGLRGASFTAGGPGASVNFGRRGTYLNTGVPGSGISYRTRIDDPTDPNASNNLALAGGLLAARYLAAPILIGLLGLVSVVLPAPPSQMTNAGSDRSSSAQNGTAQTRVATVLDTTTSAKSEKPVALIPVPRSGIRELQQGLTQLGFRPGPADGLVGSKTTTAVKLFQLSHGQEATGQIDGALIERVLIEARQVTSSIRP
jgi:Protein of unknown function (DUF4236)/Putative peptidoglycan binding domain